MHRIQLAARLLPVLPAIAASMTLLSMAGCASNDPGNVDLERRIEQRNTAYDQRLDRREIRRRGRDERFERWYQSL